MSPGPSPTGLLLAPRNERVAGDQDTEARRKRDHYVGRFEVYRVLAESDLHLAEVRGSAEVRERLRHAGMNAESLEPYWQRVRFIAERCRGRVLELGCACGNVTRHIASNPLVTEVYAVDTVPEFVEQLRAYRFPKVTAVEADARVHRYPGRFDCVVLAELLEHLRPEEERELLAGLRAALAPGATIVVTTPLGFMPDPDHVRGFERGKLEAHLERYYGKVLEHCDNGVQQFALVSAVAREAANEAVQPGEERCAGGPPPRAIAQGHAPRVSIVLPTYNHVGFLAKAVEDVRRQTFDDFELVIVDDGSTDGTGEYLDGVCDERIRAIRLEHGGLPRALNTGFEWARGELLSWISADNRLSPGFLERLVEALDAEPRAGLAYSAFGWIDADGRRTGVHRDQEFTLRRLLCSNPGLASFLYRRECRDAVGEYDTELEGAEDWDYWIRFAERFRAVYVPEPLVDYRIHGDSLSARIPERIRDAARRTFQNALDRRQGRIDLAELYPCIDRCGDPGVARFLAAWDFGVRLLASPWNLAGPAADFLGAAYESVPAAFSVAANLAVAMARADRIDEAAELAELLRRVDAEPIQAVATAVLEAGRSGRTDGLDRLDSFAPDPSAELFVRERASFMIHDSRAGAAQAGPVEPRPETPSLAATTAPAGPPAAATVEVAPEVRERVDEEILRGNPWYVGSQFEWAERPEIRGIYRRRHEFFVRCIDHVRARTGRPLRLLDAGCGDGYWLHRLSGLPDLELTGIDYNPVRVERARAAAPGARVLLGDLMELEPGERFDVVLLNQVIEHVDDDQELLRRVRRLVTNEGTLVVGTPNEGSWLHRLRQARLGERFETDHVHFYTEQEFRAKIRDAGFILGEAMREVFFVGNDDVYYKLLEEEWGFELLELLTFVVPSGCSDFYFECRPAASAEIGAGDGTTLEPDVPAVDAIRSRLAYFLSRMGPSEE